MIRLGLRLTIAGGRESVLRLVLIAGSVALGCGLLLAALAGINAVHAQNGRYAWLETGLVPAGAHGHALDSAWWKVGGDYIGNQVIGRVDVAATGPDGPVPPGMPRLPGPGHYYASPALSRLLRDTPADQLADRYPGRQAGVIGAAALPSPDSLMIVIGHTPAQLDQVPGAMLVNSISTANPGVCAGSGCLFGAGMNAAGMDLVLSVIACALLFPILIFIGAATRLSAARREQRFAAMRLAGATPQQVCFISAVEAAVASAAGTASGFWVFFLLRAPLAGISFTGMPFFTDDLSLSVPDILLVAAGVPAASAIAALLALRRVLISPLGVSRRAAQRPPGAWRLLPLIAGVAELAWFTVAGRPGTVSAQTQGYLPGFLLIMAGLVIAGPWVTMAGARLMVVMSRRPDTLIAARRLADNPKAGFRAVSGLVLALFITTVAVAVITPLADSGGVRHHGPQDGNVMMTDFSDGQIASQARPVPPWLLTRLRVAGNVAVVHADPHGSEIPASYVGRPARSGSLRAGLISCVQLAGIAGFGRCPNGATAVAVPADGGLGLDLPDVTWPAVSISATRLAALPAETIVVATNGSAVMTERARTTLEAAFPYTSPPATLNEASVQNARLITAYEQLADMVILVSLPIAGCTLAVGVAGGLSERKRPFALLRLAGAPLNALRRVVAMESALPLLSVAVVATGAGFLASWLFLKAQLGDSLATPGAEYYVTVGGGLALSLGIVTATLPLLAKITGPETARNE